MRTVFIAVATDKFATNASQVSISIIGALLLTDSRRVTAVLSPPQEITLSSNMETLAQVWQFVKFATHISRDVTDVKMFLM